MNKVRRFLESPVIILFLVHIKLRCKGTEAAEGSIFWGGKVVSVSAREFLATPTLRCSKFTRAFVCVQ